MSDPSFWEKLKRRHVVKVGIAYVVVGTAVGAAAETFLPGLGAPDWMLASVLALLVLGLPVALVMAWAYELTPEGIVRDDSVQDVAPALVDVAEERKSVVVLPFDNMSPDPHDAYFSDGLTEEIITHLSHLASLRVISRSSAMVLKNSQKDIRTIGRELNVQYVMEGSVRKAGDDLRITAQLIDAETDAHLWAETYDRELKDVFAIQSEIALKVCGELRTSLSAGEKARIEQKPTESMGAHDFYLVGKHHWWSFTPEGLLRSKEYFEKALELDPDYARAHAGLA